MSSDVPAANLSPSRMMQLAEAAVAKYPKSAIEIALEFLKDTFPAFCCAENDRLVKIGRNIASLVAMKEETSLEAGLCLILEECRHLLETDIQVPKVRFGKTELQMPIVTLGCMRFQQQWGRAIDNMDQVYSDCQENLLQILRRAIVKYGINHIETAWGYGSSQLQLGVALKQMMMNGEIKREDLIIQTKVGPREDLKEFREMVDECFERLQVDYVDMFAFHGLNGLWQWDWMFEGEDNCWKVIQEYKAAGKIGHIGFSTHGPSDLIHKFIATEKFDYVNIHHHFCGSYTATGDGAHMLGNAPNVLLANKLDMGGQWRTNTVLLESEFLVESLSRSHSSHSLLIAPLVHSEVSIISVLDKGGKIYEPSRKLRSLTLPDLEPFSHALGWLWNLEEFDAEKAVAHTVQVGFARPVDLDQCVVPAYLQGKGELLPLVKAADARLRQAQVDALGEDWLKTCYEGILKSDNSKYLVEHTQTIWLYNCILAWGMLEFAKDRYKMLVQNLQKYDPSLPREEAIDKIGRIGWGFCPGLSPDPEKDYFVDDLSGVPEKNRARVKEAYALVKKWCAPDERKEKENKEKANYVMKEEKPVPPKEWQKAFDLKPWKDFPDRPYP